MFLVKMMSSPSFIFYNIVQQNDMLDLSGSFCVNAQTPADKPYPWKKICISKILSTSHKTCLYAEISRFALVNNQIKHKDFSELQLRTLLSLALMCATRINFFLYHYSKIFAIMERSLHRILKRQSVAFEPIGDASRLLWS